MNDPEKPKIEEISLDLIRLDGGTQPRAKINLDHVKMLEEQIQEGERLDPILLFYDGEAYWVADGFHRIHAHRNQNFQTIASEIKQGTRRDAVLYSVGANAEHKPVLPRSRADKRRAVITLLTDAEWQQWSNYKIAAATKVNEKTVRNIRKDLTAEVRSEPQTRTYTTKHGTQSIMNTSNIGKTPKVELAEGIKVKIQDDSPLSPGLKGEITSLPNSSSAIVLFEDGTREMVDREYIKPGLEELPQSLILRSTRVNPPTTPKVQATGKTSTPSTSKNEPTSRKEELDQKQEELGLGERRQSVLPESDRIDELQHSNPTDIDDRPFARPIAFTEEDSQELTTLVANIKKTVKFLRLEDYRSIGDAIGQNKPEGVEELIKTFAKNKDTARLMVSELKLVHPDLFE